MIKKIFNHFWGRKAIRDAGWIYAGSIFNNASLLFLNILIARAITQEAFGIYTLSLLALGVATDMSDFGLNGSLMRFASYYSYNKQWSKLRQLVKTIWSWRVRMSVVITLGGLVSAGLIARYVFGHPEVTPYLRLSFLGVGGVVLLGFIAIFLQASQRFAASSVVQGLKGALRLALVGLCLMFGLNNLFLIMAVYLAVPWLLLAGTYWYLPRGKNTEELDEADKKKLHSQLAKFSFWLTVWSFITIISSRVDQVIISNLMGLQQVATYAVAMQLVIAFTIISQSISSVLTPKFSALTSNEEVKKLIWYSLKWILPLFVALMLLVYPSELLIVLFFGHKYVAAGPIYMILSFGFLMSLPFLPATFIINVFNRTDLLALGAVLQLVFNATLNYFLISAYGITGAAITFGLTVLFSSLYNLACSAYLIKHKEFSVA